MDTHTPFGRGPRGGFGGPGPIGDHHGGGPHTLGWVLFALQLLTLIALAALLVRAFAAPRFAGPPPWRRRVRDPLAHLHMRYASGEISREEYLQARQDLELPAS